jgi:hypothetical protein
MPNNRSAPDPDTVDSATDVQPDAQGKDRTSSNRKKDGKGTSRASRPTPRTKAEPSSGKQTPGFADCNNALLNYGLSISGRKERILSAVKTDKFFHFVDQSWKQLVDLKPHLSERFSLAEFRHASALQLYHRIESVKFDALGIKPSAKTRIPLPRNTRVFQPLWSVLANIGTVDDDDLRVIYIPDGQLPETGELTSEKDIEGLLTCTLYDWLSSWNKVLSARATRQKYQERDGVTESTTTNETPSQTREQLMANIAELRRNLAAATRAEESDKFFLVDGYLYSKYRERRDSDSKSEEKFVEMTKTQALKESKKIPGVIHTSNQLESLYQRARDAKQERITPRFDVSQRISSYRIADGEISADAGAYGEWLHWDPQLWLDYEQFVEIVTPIAMFSLSMPAESSGSYAWILPVEKREGDDSNVSARLPKASIAPVTWTLALLLQSSTLPLERRSTFYVETDRLANVMGLRARYIRAAVKDPTAVEQYGTY